MRRLLSPFLPCRICRITRRQTAVEAFTKRPGLRETVSSFLNFAVVRV